MNRLFFIAAFLLGAAAVIWMASTFVGINNLALTVTLVIGCVYAIGFMELLQFRAATITLANGLAKLPETMEEGAVQLTSWLENLHPSLQNAVRLRIEGERVGLPAPVVTPYLVGLLVMLGLLGTFVGMVDTLSGAVIALEGTTELQAIRAGLAAPINGLSVAFGTSVAGVAASAMLGLISTLTRRDRMLETRVLDGKIATVFRTFSLAHNRQETYKALQMQARVLPEVAEQLTAMAVQLGRSSEQLSDKLLASQQQFHESAQATYRELAASVELSMKTSLAESGRMAGESIKPVLEQAMEGIASEAQTSQGVMVKAAQQQVDALTASFSRTSEQVASAWQAGLVSHEVANKQLLENIRRSLDDVGERLQSTSESVLGSFAESSSAWAKQQELSERARFEQWAQSLAQSQRTTVAQLNEVVKQFTDELSKSTQLQQVSLRSASDNFESMSGAVTSQWEDAGGKISQLTTTLKTELGTLQQLEEQRGEAAIERLGALEATVATHLAALGKEMEAPMARLIETASETPRAAAEVIGRLREEVSNNIERDNQLLVERQRIMEQLNTLSGSLEQASHSQREALESMVSSSAKLLQKVGDKFDQQVGSQVGEMSGIAENFSGSAIEMASLGEAFTVAVNLFNESNGKLMDSLVRIEQSLDNANTRSDKQMNYYVAQARQIIDHSMQSQKEVFEELRHLGSADVDAVTEAG